MGVGEKNIGGSLRSWDTVIGKAKGATPVGPSKRVDAWMQGCMDVRSKGAWSCGFMDALAEATIHADVEAENMEGL